MNDPDARPPRPVPAAGLFSLATAGALFTVLIWGGSPLMTKLGARSIDEFSLALIRTVGALPLAVLIVAALRLALPWRGADKLLILGVAVTGVIGFPVLFTLGVALTSAGHAVVVNSATPIFVGLIEALASRRWPALRWWAGVSVAFAGVVILIGEAIGLDSAGATWQGDLLVAAGALSAAASFVLGARLTPRHGAVCVTMWSVVLAALLQLPFLAVRFGPAAWAAVEPIGWAAAAYLCAGSTVLAYITWIFALSRGGIGRMSVWQFALPVVGIALAAVFLAEPLTPPLLAATAVILAGVALVQRR